MCTFPPILLLDGFFLPELTSKHAYYELCRKAVSAQARDIIISGTLKITASGKARLNATLDIAASTAGVVAV